MIYLPEKYLENIKQQLGGEFEEFLASYQEPARRGLRFNKKKARPETVQKLIREWNLQPVEWCPAGYTYTDVRPGLSPYHDAGVFYMQEPSAMCVVEEAGLKASDVVLDLCAAPGGKTTAAAERCAVLLANEIIPGRAKILSSNVERMGVENAVVCSADPSELAGFMEGYFDVVITDAPCSGEGMMRKDETAVEEWSEENVSLCIARQKKILDSAAKMVRPGGKLVYSTCTFETGENEEQIHSFLKNHPGFCLLSMRRIWPHKQQGEGHFCAVMQNGSEKTSGNDGSSCNAAEVSSEAPAGNVRKALTAMEKLLRANHIHILRSGLVTGNAFKDKKGKEIYEPSHAEIMASVFETCGCGVNLKSESLALSYLHGEVLRPAADEAEFKGEDGFCGVYYDGYPLGTGKRIGNTIKNHLPKGLRRIG